MSCFTKAAMPLCPPPDMIFDTPPPPYDDGPGYISETETLRDRFAMAALTGLLAAKLGSWGSQDIEAAYSIADAMMEARK